MPKTCIVTGATSGIGKAACNDLVQRGYKLVLVGRSESRCIDTINELKKINPESELEYFLADLSSRKEVLSLAKNIKSKYSYLDILVNNAGAVFVNKELSVDGIEMTMALNHFGYFWLTMELLELLKQGTSARIINVSSAAHKRAVISNVESIETGFDVLGYMAYGNSKLANLWFTFELAKRLKEFGITVNALHPGLVATRFGANNGLMGIPLKLLMTVAGLSPEQGARTVSYLVDSSEVEGATGGYYVKEKLISSSNLSLNQKLQNDFFEFSARKTREIDQKLS